MSFVLFCYPIKGILLSYICVGIYFKHHTIWQFYPWPQLAEGYCCGQFRLPFVHKFIIISSCVCHSCRTMMELATNHKPNNRNWPSWCLSQLVCESFSLYPPNNEVVGGYIGFTPSVRPSRLPCPLCNIYSSGWILSILNTNDHYHERVCRTRWPWPISSRSFGLDLENRVRSVASTVLDRFFLYLAQMITIIRWCVACYVFFQNLKIWIFGKFLKFFGFALEKKIYSSWWILSIFGTNDH